MAVVLIALAVLGLTDRDADRRPRASPAGFANWKRASHGWNARKYLRRRSKFPSPSRQRRSRSARPHRSCSQSPFQQGAPPAGRRSGVGHRTPLDRTGSDRADRGRHGVLSEIRLRESLDWRIGPRHYGDRRRSHAGVDRTSLTDWRGRYLSQILTGGGIVILYLSVYGAFYRYYYSVRPAHRFCFSSDPGGGSAPAGHGV